MLINQPRCSLISPANPRLRISVLSSGLFDCFFTLGSIFTNLFLDLTWSWWHFPKYNKRLTVHICWIKFTVLLWEVSNNGGLWNLEILLRAGVIDTFKLEAMGGQELQRSPGAPFLCPECPSTYVKRMGIGKPTQHCVSNPGTNNLELDIHGVPLCPSLLGMALMMLCQHNYSYCPFLLPKYPVWVRL